jgi:hypothetical protein
MKITFIIVVWMTVLFSVVGHIVKADGFDSTYLERFNREQQERRYEQNMLREQRQQNYILQQQLNQQRNQYYDDMRYRQFQGYQPYRSQYIGR